MNTDNIFIGVTKEDKALGLIKRAIFGFVEQDGQWKNVSAHFSPRPMGLSPNSPSIRRLRSGVSPSRLLWVTTMDRYRVSLEEYLPQFIFQTL